MLERLVLKRLQDNGRFFLVGAELWYEQKYFPGYVDPLRTPKCFRHVDVFRQTIRLEVLTAEGIATKFTDKNAYFVVGVLQGEETYRFCPPLLGGSVYGELTAEASRLEGSPAPMSARVLLNLFAEDVRRELENDNG